MKAANAKERAASAEERAANEKERMQNEKERTQNEKARTASAKEVRDLKTEIRGLKTANANMKTEIRSLKTEIQGLNVANEDLEAIIESNKDEIANLKKETVQIRNDARVQTAKLEEELRKVRDSISTVECALYLFILLSVCGQPEVIATKDLARLRTSQNRGAFPSRKLGCPSKQRGCRHISRSTLRIAFRRPIRH